MSSSRELDENKRTNRDDRAIGRIVSYRREPRGEKRRKEIGEKRLPLLAPTDSNTVPDAGNMVARDATTTDFLINR